jgi:hypothetical protein
MRSKANLVVVPKDRYMNVREKSERKQMIIPIFYYEKYSYQIDTFQNQHQK